ncbi:MAG: DNA primase [Rhizorhabdus sp.]
MTIPTSWLDQLRDRTTLSALVTKTVPLKRKGKEWSACCPFHNEKTPSFTVNDDKGFYHCFGCSAHGDAIRWMTDQCGMTFIDAVKELAQAAGMEVPAQDPRAAEREKAKDGNLEIMERAASRFRARLSDVIQEAPGNYLHSRGIELAELSKFGIGFAPMTRMGDKPFIAEIGASSEKLVELGLLKANPAGVTVYDFFRNRIMIPIHDARGRVIGFGGRIIGEGQPKYLNSPDTPVFDKGRTLFNLHRAAPAARAKDRLLIVEGYFDVIGLASVGIDEAVAPNGTALTEAQMALAWRLVDSPTIWFDGDKAGRAAALRAAMRALPLLTAGKGLWFIFAPEGQDPDDIARKQGADAVSALLGEQEGIVDILWREALERLKKGKGDTAATSRVRKDIRDMLGSIKDVDVREVFANEFQERMHAFQQRAAITSHRSTAPARQAVNTAVEEALAKGILRHIAYLNRLGEAVSCLTWTRPDAARLFDALLWQTDEAGGVTPDNLAEVLERRGLGDDYRAVMALQPIRFPFLVGPVTDATAEELHKAIRSQAGA